MRKKKGLGKSNILSKIISCFRTIFATFIKFLKNPLKIFKKNHQNTTKRYLFIISRILRKLENELVTLTPSSVNRQNTNKILGMMYWIHKNSQKLNYAKTTSIIYIGIKLVHGLYKREFKLNNEILHALLLMTKAIRRISLQILNTGEEGSTDYSHLLETMAYLARKDVPRLSMLKIKEQKKRLIHSKYESGITVLPSKQKDLSVMPSRKIGISPVTLEEKISGNLDKVEDRGVEQKSPEIQNAKKNIGEEASHKAEEILEEVIHLGVEKNVQEKGQESGRIVSNEIIQRDSQESRAKEEISAQKENMEQSSRIEKQEIMATLVEEHLEVNVEKLEKVIEEVGVVEENVGNEIFLEEKVAENLGMKSGKMKEEPEMESEKREEVAEEVGEEKNIQEELSVEEVEDSEEQQVGRDRRKSGKSGRSGSGECRKSGDRRIASGRDRRKSGKSRSGECRRSRSGECRRSRSGECRRSRSGECRSGECRRSRSGECRRSRSGECRRSRSGECRRSRSGECRRSG